MKIKKIAIATFLGVFGLSSLAMAGNYTPPERIQCHLTDAGKLSCNEFNRQLLAEDTYTAHFPAGEEVVLSFTSGVAYFTSQDEWSVYYTYTDKNKKVVKLRSTNTNIKPVLNNTGWVKFKEEFYNCKTGYMSCPISNSAK